MPSKSSSKTSSIKVGRYFLTLLGVLVVIYALVFGTGDHSLKPKLGLDLEGGTTVTLTAVTSKGQAPDQEDLRTAKNIIEQRVNGLGVAEAEVVTAGSDNIVISVPGKGNDAVKQIAQTAQLRFRQVASIGDGSGQPAQTTPSVVPSGAASGAPKATGSPSAKASATPKAGTSPKALAPLAPAPAFSLAANAKPLAASGTPSPAASPKASATPKASPSPSASPSPTGSAAPGGAAEAGTDPYANVPPAQLFANPAVTCQKLASRPPGSSDAVDKQQVACDSSGQKYLLNKAEVVGTDVSSANFGQTSGGLGGWQVNIDFTGSGQKKWTNLTKVATVATPPTNQVAIVLDGEIVSAPTIQEVINTSAQITGTFTRDQAESLSNVLKYGSLPLTFRTSQALTVSPTLGTQQLEAGLLAGGIGLALVVVYSLLYYRALGLVTIASLIVSAALVYGSIVLLGRSIGFTLSLSGIAGFIVAVGITADSFVVFFERIKDEVKVRRSARSAVPRAWVRARRTIISADVVSLLAAVILYIFTTGDVKGFAFTLGLSTVIDVVVVFLFTHPLVAWASRSKAFENARMTGLGNVRHHEEPKAAPGRVRPPTPKES